MCLSEIIILNSSISELTTNLITSFGKSLNVTTLSRRFLNSGVKALFTASSTALLPCFTELNPILEEPIFLAPAFDVITIIQFLKSAFLPWLSVSVA